MPITSRFPDTRLSVLEALTDADPETRRDAAELVVRAYRGPVVDHFRWRWSLDEADAEDLAQEFFAAALEKEWLGRFDPARGRFRIFLRTCAQRFAAKRHAADGRLKRGGNAVILSFDDLGEQPHADDVGAEQRFRTEWVRAVFQAALDALRAEGEVQERTVHLALFEAYDLAEHDAVNRPTYAELGAHHDLGASQVINHLAWARRRFRHHVLGVLRRLAASEAEYREDVRDLLGITPP